MLGLFDQFKFGFAGIVVCRRFSEHASPSLSIDDSVGSRATSLTSAKIPIRLLFISFDFGCVECSCGSFESMAYVFRS